ncbi:putative glycosyltransferase [Paenibacillus sp. JGP012]|uniref:glycosyltransferase n=1 Tax=Paenibacillus sp. JGP012 TaxID=2735914 RepID=UPI0016209073|nr:glycosyltransferase [Paenibacillus sp. JGP012]MBB6022223.1 putative glycosyltransferase [Paenibacillus sp. JGP012]
MKVLFVSRGNGFGHAKRDLLVAQRLIQFNHEVIIASYSSGLQYLQRVYSGQLIDLKLPSAGSSAERTSKLLDLIRCTQPDGIVVDEELLVLPIAKSMGIPTCFITNWLEDEPEIVGYLQMADQIAIVDQQDHWMFGAADSIREKLNFVGPVVEVPERTAAREKKIVITSGSATLVDVPFFRKAISDLKGETDYIKLVYSGTLTKSLQRLGDETTQFIADPGSFMDEVRDSSLVVCRGGHTTLWELASLGIPAIAVPRREEVNRSNIVYARQMGKRGYIRWLEESGMDQGLIAKYASEILRGQTELQTYAYDGTALDRLTSCILESFFLTLAEESL